MVNKFHVVVVSNCYGLDASLTARGNQLTRFGEPTIGSSCSLAFPSAISWRVNLEIAFVIVRAFVHLIPHQLTKVIPKSPSPR
jgi:hypothetical protein